eukprot:g43588.t1
MRASGRTITSTGRECRPGPVCGAMRAAGKMTGGTEKECTPGPTKLCRSMVFSSCSFLFKMGLSPALPSSLLWPTWTILAIPQEAAVQLSQQTAQLAALQLQTADNDAFALCKKHFNEEYKTLLSSFHQHDKELCTVSVLPSLSALGLYLTLVLGAGYTWWRQDLTVVCLAFFLFLFLLLILDISLTATSFGIIEESNQRTKASLMSQAKQLHIGDHRPDNVVLGMAMENLHQNLESLDVKILCAGKPIASMSMWSLSSLLGMLSIPLSSLLGMLSVPAAGRSLILSIYRTCFCRRAEHLHSD